MSSNEGEQLRRLTGSVGRDKDYAVRMDLYGGIRQVRWTFQEMKSIALAIHECADRAGIEPGHTYLDAQVIMHATMDADPGALVPESAPNYQDTTHLAHWSYWWAHYGMPTFRLSRSLASALLLTDCTSLRGRDLQIPFPAILVAIPDNPPLLEMSEVADGKETNRVPVRFIHWHRLKTVRNEADRLYVQQLFEEFRYLERRGMQRAAHEARAKWIATMQLKQTSWMSIVELVADGNPIMTNTRSPWPADDAPLEVWLEAPDKLQDTPGSEPMTDLDKQAMRAAFRLLANLTLYLQEQHGKQGGKRAPYVPRPTQIGKAGFPKIWEMGRELKMPAALQKAARDFSHRREGGRAARGWRVQKRFTVRGHWRAQAHGPRWSLRKRIWIAPFWKGPRTIDEALARLYAADVLGE